MYARFEDSGLGFYWLTSTNHAPLVADLKAEVPAHLRQWDPARKSWMLDPAAILTVARLVKRHLGIDAPVPPIAVAAQHASTRFFRVVYIGSPKYREDNTYTATAYCEDEHGAGEWKLVIPIGALRGYFEGDLAALFADQNTDDEWALIGLDRDAAGRGEYTPEQIKRAARLAKAKAHPDQNGGTPEAHEQFLKVTEAADVLSAPRGIHFSIMGATEFEKARQKRLSEATNKSGRQYNYAPPRRTGWMLVEGADLLGGRQVLVSKIVGFEDITDAHGRVLTAGIPRGKRTPVPHWLVVP